MSVFTNFFLKTIAFFIASTVFILFIVILFSYFNLQQEVINKNTFEYLEGDKNSNNNIAILKLKGPILNEPSNFIEFSFFENINVIYVSEIEKDLKELESKKLKGLIISIDSPGGSVSATYKLYKTIKKFKEKYNLKIFFHTNELLASGGYWVAMASDKIFADYGALIGSIGVRGPDWIYYDQPISISSGILSKQVETKDGIKKYRTIAGRSKDLFDPFRMPTEEEIQSLQNIVNGIYLDFINTVSSSRKLERQFIIEDLGAIIFDSNQAKDNYLIDQVMNINDVTNQMIKELDLLDYKLLIKKKTNVNFVETFFQSKLFLEYDILALKKDEICGLMSNYINTLYIGSNKYFENNC